MNRIPLLRFTGGIRPGIYVLGFILTSCSLSGDVITALAGQNPQKQDASNAADKPQASSIEIPGTFKDLPEASKLTSKHVGDAVTTREPARTTADLTIDSSKVTGTARANRLATLEGTKEEELLDFHATAYCLRGRTASGEHTRVGIIAADPKLLPLGTIVHLKAGPYTGTYTVLDTGSRIKGKVIDVYVATKQEAMAFGRRPVKLKVVGRPSKSKDAGAKSVAVDSSR